MELSGSSHDVYSCSISSTEKKERIGGSFCRPNRCRNVCVYLIALCWYLLIACCFQRTIDFFLSTFIRIWILRGNSSPVVFWQLCHTEGQTTLAWESGMFWVNVNLGNMLGTSDAHPISKHLMFACAWPLPNVVSLVCFNCLCYLLPIQIIYTPMYIYSQLRNAWRYAKMYRNIKNWWSKTNQVERLTTRISQKSFYKISGGFTIDTEWWVRYSILPIVCRFRYRER